MRTMVSPFSTYSAPARRLPLQTASSPTPAMRMACASRSARGLFAARCSSGKCFRQKARVSPRMTSTDTESESRGSVKRHCETSSSRFAVSFSFVDFGRGPCTLATTRAESFSITFVARPEPSPRMSVRTVNLPADKCISPAQVTGHRERVTGGVLARGLPVIRHPLPALIDVLPRLQLLDRPLEILLVPLVGRLLQRGLRVLQRLGVIALRGARARQADVRRPHRAEALGVRFPHLDGLVLLLLVS